MLWRAPLGRALGGAVFGLFAGAAGPSAAGLTSLYIIGTATAVIAFTAAAAIPRSAT